MSNYSTEKLVDLHENNTSEEVMIKARSQLSMSSVGLTSMLIKLALREDNSFSTMATDGKEIVYNSDFVKSLPMEEIKGVLIHEALHVVYEHHLRRGERNPKLWNVATDYVINAYIVYDLRLPLPEGGLLDRQYRGWSAEKVFQHLYENDDDLQEAMNSLAQQGEEGSELEEENITSNNSDSGSGSEESGEGETNASGEINLNDIPETVGGVFDLTNDDGKKLSEEELNQESYNLRKEIFQMNKIEKMVGNGGNVDYLGDRVGELRTENHNWREELQEHLIPVDSDANDWNRPNRRHVHNGMYLPSRKREDSGGCFALMFDVSGSVGSQERDACTNEVISIANDLGVTKLMAMRFAHVPFKNEDGEYWDIHDLDSGDELTDMKDLNLYGGGGTSFDPPFEVFNNYTDEADEVQAIIFFTDGYGDISAESEPDVPVIWAITEKEEWSNFEPPFGEVVFVSV